VHCSLQEIAVSQINHTVAFLRQKDVVLSDDRWLAVISSNLTHHPAVLTELESKLHTAKEMTEQSTSIGELLQIEALRSLKEK
jgi:hypothetical protein